MLARLLLRRSVLYMPGLQREGALAKAATLPADAPTLDLEDLVAPDAKETARSQVVEAAKGDFAGVKSSPGSTVRIRRGARPTRSPPPPPAPTQFSCPKSMVRPPSCSPHGSCENTRAPWIDLALGDDGDAERDPNAGQIAAVAADFGLAARRAGHGRQRSREGRHARG